MTSNVLPFPPRRGPNTTTDLFTAATSADVTQAIVIGLRSDGKPYIDATNDLMLSQLCWMVMFADEWVREFVRTPK